MHNRFREGRTVRLGAVLAAVFFLTTAVWAKDWHELRELNETQLAEEISQFQKKLDQDPSDHEMLKGLGIAYHIRAEKDAKKYARRAVEWLSKAHEIDKSDNETLCYLGSANTLMANTTWNPMRKLSYANRGIALMDKAVRRDPDNVSVRMTRAINSRRLPSFLRRGNVALEDFEYLAGLIAKNPDFPRSIKKTIYTHLAELYSKAKDRASAREFRKLAEGL